MTNKSTQLTTSQINDLMTRFNINDLLDNVNLKDFQLRYHIIREDNEASLKPIEEHRYVKALDDNYSAEISLEFINKELKKIMYYA